MMQWTSVVKINNLVDVFVWLHVVSARPRCHGNGSTPGLQMLLQQLHCIAKSQEIIIVISSGTVKPDWLISSHVIHNTTT